MIVAVVGPIGSGKDLVSDALVSDYGFEKHSLGDALREELRERGIEITRKSLQDVGDELRKTKSPDYLAKKVSARLTVGRDYIFTSIRNPAELAFLKNMFSEMKVIMVDAPFGKRFDNLQRRGRENDPRTLEEFREVEERDFGVGQEGHAQQNAGCFELADRVIVNNGDIEELKKKIGKVVEGLKEN